MNERLSIATQLLHGGLPVATRDGDIAGQFHFFVGGSGRRHLFTEIDVEWLAAFRGVVAVALAPGVRLDAGGWVPALAVRPIEEETDAALFRSVGAGSKVRTFVHFLGGTPAVREAIAADLLEACGVTRAIAA